MGSVRRMLPRVAALGATAAGVVLLLASRGAGAQEAPPANALDTVSGAVGALLPPATPPAAPSDPPPALPLPDLSDAPAAVGPPVQPVTGVAAPVLGAAQPVVGSLLSPARPAAVPLTSPTTLPALSSLSLDGLVPAPLTGPTPANLPSITAPLGAPDDLVALATGRTPRLSGLPFTAPDLDDLDLAALVPTLTAPPTGIPVTPFPLPQPHPTDPAGEFLRAATPPAGATIQGSERATGPGDAVLEPPDQGVMMVLAAIQHAFDDPGGRSNPARGPPDELPRDPSHRGSSDHVSQYLSLPGTDRIGVTRGESWHAGTDVEMSNTPPEPSVSPD